MADKAEKKAEAPASAPDAHGEKKEGGKGGGILTKLPVLLGGVMIIEAAVLFAGFKFLGSGQPQAAEGAELAEGHGDGGHGEAGEHAEHGEGASLDPKRTVEINVLSFKALNKLSGRAFLYDVTIFARTKGEYETRVTETIKANEALISDRIRTIIAQSDPEKLGGGSEPGLETLRRQVKHQLDEIIGEGMIDEVLVPKCIPFRTDY
jgi:flagellar basal body-associated protein FliL